MYVFVRQDMPIEMQIVHSNHAVFNVAAELGRNETLSGISNVIVIAVADEGALQRAQDKLSRDCISYYAWHDPDDKFGSLMAVATYPLDASKRSALRQYRTYRTYVVADCQMPSVISGTVSV